MIEWVLFGMLALVIIRMEMYISKLKYTIGITDSNFFKITKHLIDLGVDVRCVVHEEELKQQED